MTHDLLTPTLAELAARRGQWPAICRATGLDYDWLTKLAQGRITDPGVRKIQRLATHFADHARSCDEVVHLAISTQAAFIAPVVPESVANEGAPAVPPEALRAGIVRRHTTRRAKDLPIDAGRRHTGPPFQSFETGVA